MYIPPWVVYSPLSFLEVQGLLSSDTSRTNLIPWRFTGWYLGWPPGWQPLDHTSSAPSDTCQNSYSKPIQLKSYSLEIPWVFPWVVPGWQLLGHTGDASCDICSKINTAKPFKSYSLEVPWVVPWVVPGWQPLGHTGDASCNTCSEINTAKPLKSYSLGGTLGGPWVTAPWVILVMPLVALAPKFTQQSHSHLTPWVVPWVVPGWQPLGHTGDASCNACSEINTANHSNLTPWVVPWVIPGWQPLSHTGGASCDTCSEIHTAKPFKSYSLANSLGGSLDDPWMAPPGSYW